MKLLKMVIALTSKGRLLVLLLALALTGQLWSGTTGKIAGTVVDRATGEPLPGANIVVVGTTLGAAADLNGQYTILHIPPGTYKVQVSVIGYRKVTVSDVRVYIDQTARVDVTLEEEAIQLGESVIIAERPLIKPDVATSVVAVSDKEVQDLPVQNIVNVIGLQAGISGGLSNQLSGAAQPTFVSNYARGRVSVQGDLSIRGGGGDNILFMLDGVTLRDPRNNEPITKVALSAVKEISVERGGFNAEYGQVRSGIVNVVTKEGSTKGYFGSIQTRVRPPGPKYWRGDGIYDIHDPNSYVMRPFFDPAVAWTGTLNGAWDTYTRRQYPEFRGWNEISRILNTDNDPTNDLTPQAAQRIFMYETRKKPINDQPDYEIDAGFGGPIPVVSQKLGNLRFFTSYRSNREMLLFPLTRPDYRDYDWSMRLTSDITPTMKLRISSLVGKQLTIRHNWDSSNNAGLYFYPRRPNEIAGVINDASVSTNGLIGMFSDYNFPLADIGHRSVSAKLTHTISARAFYEVSLEHFRRNYHTRPAAWRDTSNVSEIIPGYFVDSNPFGYWPYDSKGVVITGGQHVAKTRDFSVVSSTTLKADFSTQINFQNLVKAGIELDYNDLDFDYGVIKSATAGQTYSQRVQMRTFPIRAAVYLQDKLEAKGFTMNAGLRLDYSDSRADWWEVNSFDALFFSSRYNDERVFPQKSSKPQWQLSPRLGVAHPITENSKLFFNYGHFKQNPQYESLFRVERGDTRQMTSFGDPNLILAKTISYELGYDQILLNNILLQLAAYYNDITDQQDFTRYTSTSGGYTYTQTTSNNYEDVRGFEATLRKTSGRWWAGFANFTYQVSNTGHFGSSRRFDNPADQKSWNEATVNLYQDRPIPRPNARANVNFYTPNDFGPSLFGQKALGGFRLNVLLDWQAGYWTTWNPRGLPSVAYNVKSLDFFNVALRLDKTVDIKKIRMQFFMDMNNALNTRRLWNTGDVDYLASLHLPKSDAYSNIPGNDKVGDYRKPGVEFVPMEYARSAANLPATPPSLESGRRLLHYVEETGSYMEYQNGAWQTADPAFVGQVLKDKAYIDMPNASTFWFLDPRQIFFGVRLSFDFTE